MGHHDLVLFDLDGTLIRSFMREGGGGASQDYDLVEAMPGALERVDRLHEDGTHVAFVTNQGGVAFGYQTVEQVMAKMACVCGLFGLPYNGGWACVGVGLAVTFDGLPISYEQALEACPPGVYVSLGHPNAKVERYRVDSGWRKPGGDMIGQAMADYEVHEPSLVLFVGDMETDRQAAEAAGVEYADAGEYFA